MLPAPSGVPLRLKPAAHQLYSHRCEGDNLVGARSWAFRVFVGHCIGREPDGVSDDIGGRVGLASCRPATKGGLIGPIECAGSRHGRLHIHKLAACRLPFLHGELHRTCFNHKFKLI
jgi:hypothetical protein